VDQGIIFDIQRYSLHDGAGIRTIIFFKGCPLKCEWCSNPESQDITPQLVYNYNKCNGCGRCTFVCPYALGKDFKSLNDCKLCGKCAHACPTGALEIIGRKVSIQEVLDEVEKDRGFYDISGGGVTLSGGEPLMQWEFAANLVNELKKRYFRVAIETTGYAPWKHVEAVVSGCDEILYDVKHMDSEIHKKYTGVPNELILENAKKIADMKLNIIIRIPLLGGINDDDKNISDVIKFASDLNIEQIHLLPYHRLGEPKYKKLGRKYVCTAVIPSEEKIEEIKSKLESKGFIVKVGG